MKDKDMHYFMNKAKLSILQHKIHAIRTEILYSEYEPSEVVKELEEVSSEVESETEPLTISMAFCRVSLGLRCLWWMGVAYALPPIMYTIGVLIEASERINNPKWK